MAGRVGWLDGLRGAAALLVVAHHVELTAYPGGGHAPGALGLGTTWLAFGFLAVPVFVTVSGYSLALPVLRAGLRLPHGARDFARRRVRRIVPPYLIALAVAVALNLTLLRHPSGSHWDVTLPHSWSDDLVHALLLQDLLPALGIAVGAGPNHVFWSVAVEAHIYVLFPVLLLGWRRLGIVRATSAAAGALAVATLLLDSDAGPALPGALGNLHPELYALFALGACAAALGEGRLTRPGALAALLAAGVTAAALVDGRALALDHGPVVGLAAGGAAACLLLHCRRGGRVSRALGCRPLAWVGAWSYSAYLLHAPLLEVAWRASGERLGRLLLLTPLVLAGCWCFYALVERPLNSRRSPRTVGHRPCSTGGSPVTSAQQPAAQETQFQAVGGPATRE